MDPELYDAKLQMFIAEPDLFVEEAKWVVGYFRQLERHLAEKDDIAGLTAMAKQHKLASGVMTLESLLPFIEKGDEASIKDGYPIFIRLVETSDLYRKHFKDFSPVTPGMPADLG